MMDLYESDLSLFGGDLLAGLSSPVDSDTSLPSLVQDDYQLDILKPQVASPAGLAGELSLEGGFQLSTPAVSELLDNRWLDENTDLLDLLEDHPDGDSQLPSHVFGEDTELAPLGMAPRQGSTALQILQSLADENGRELSTSPPPSSLVCPPSRPAAVSGSSVLMGMLLDGVDKPAATTLDIITDTCMDVDVDEQLVLEASLAPILSPVSPDEVESLLSSGPCSPASAANLTGLVPPAASPSFESTDSVLDVFEDSDDSDETWLPSPPPKASKGGRRINACSTPYTKTKLSKEAKQQERKQRKKQQNRDAALRYRQKKKQEGEGVSSVCEILEAKNRELKDKADQLSREIQYLKDLMADVYRAKGLLDPKK